MPQPLTPKKLKQFIYEDLQDLELTAKKKKRERCPFHHRGLECKLSQEIPKVTNRFGLGVQNGAGQRLTVLTREYTGHSKHPFPTTQGMDIIK